jgi:hypothetical protein
LYGNQIPRNSADMTEGVEDRDSSTEKGGRIGGGESLRYRGDRFLWRDHVFGITAVEMERSDLLIPAQDEITTTARTADKTMAAMPSHTNPLTRLPKLNVSSDGIYAASNFVSGYTGILNARPYAIFHENIAVTDAACVHFDSDLAARRIRDFALHQFEISAGFADLDSFHFGHSDFLLESF